MDWSQIKLPSGKLMKVHTFLYLSKGVTWKLEVNEYSNTQYAGFGEHNSDESQQLPSVSAESLEGCVQKLLNEAVAK
ncbi:MAG: hypothetical protein AB8C84_09425 [Oligoflexales bacterium]